LQSYFISPAPAPTITIRDDSPTSSWINFFRDEVSPLSEERENEIATYPSPVGFKNSKAKTNYSDHLKKVLEGISENKREELKHKIDEGFGLLDAVYCSQYLHTNEQLGIDRTQLMTRMTTQQLRLVPIEWRQKYKLRVHQGMEEVIEKWHTVVCIL
jgi:hypothetical protein